MNNELIPYKKLLQKNGYKFTSGKRIVLETVLTNKTHLNAKEINEKTKEKNRSFYNL